MISKEENILFAAEKLFAEKGFQGTSTREISKVANVNVSMISYYFGSKEKLYEKLVEYRMQESQFFSKELLERSDIDEWEKISKLVDQFATRVRTVKCFFTIMQREQLHTENPQIVQYLKDTKLAFIRMYSDILKKGQEKGIFTKNPPVYLLHSTVSGTLFYASNSIEMYKTFLENNDEQSVFEDAYFKDLVQHIKYILKDLLGYEENK
ncbi:MAG: TetR/AcrR family transcriptional regulator [Chryseobacterium sp.]|nr:TetR/AcrR family transcriptional regulator [Candidatus Chryseobacterium enterohippi]